MGSQTKGEARLKVLQNQIVTEVAEKLGKTTAQVALRWGLQMGHSVIPKSSSEARLQENLDVFDWYIPEDLFAKFSNIPQASFFPFLLFSFYGRFESKISIFFFFFHVHYISQEKLVRGVEFAHETLGFYKTIDDLWDGEI